MLGGLDDRRCSVVSPIPARRTGFVPRRGLFTPQDRPVESFASVRSDRSREIARFNGKKRANRLDEDTDLHLSFRIILNLYWWRVTIQKLKRF